MFEKNVPYENQWYRLRADVQSALSAKFDHQSAGLAHIMNNLVTDYMNDICIYADDEYSLQVHCYSPRFLKVLGRSGLSSKRVELLRHHFRPKIASTKCRSCGAANPRMICSGCSNVIVKYCNEVCQENDWTTHRLVCRECTFCGARKARMLCQGCCAEDGKPLPGAGKSTRYCNEDCQLKHWPYHRQKCLHNKKSL